MDANNWISQLDITNPIKGIMDFVDELSRNYDRRLAALHVEYQKDIEEVLACYKQEKEEFKTQVEEAQATITKLNAQLQTITQSYNNLRIEYKLTKDSLETARLELSELTNSLQQEENLIALAKEKIRIANQQLKHDLALRGVEPATPIISTINHVEMQVTPKSRFRKTTFFLQQVVMNRLSRSIILRKKHSKEADPIDTLDEYDESF